MAQPEQLQFQFGFDKAELSEEDREVVKQHAHYLIAHPGKVLHIQGHTDHHGARVYNEYLSKKRAESVVSILLEEGVAESQLEIQAMADSAPLADNSNTRLNRRVELQYSEMNLVTNN
jgi:peptidoglycan-associated lipoprotein